MTSSKLPGFFPKADCRRFKFIVAEYRRRFDLRAGGEILGDQKLSPKNERFFPQKKGPFYKKERKLKVFQSPFFLEWFFAKLLVFEAVNLFFEILQAFIHRGH